MANKKTTKKDENKNFQNFLRQVKNFNPCLYLEKGSTPLKVKPNGEAVQPKDVFYLPTWARLAWYNTYCAEQNKVMPLTTKLLKNSNDEVIVEATLSEILENGDGTKLVIPIATGHASAFVTPGDTSTLERCETCAKGRCLGSAGFILTEEKSSMFDEGETPVDGALLDRSTATTPADAKTDVVEPEKPAKRKPGRPKKSEAKKEDPAPVQNDDNGQTFFDIPNIENLIPNASCENNDSKNSANINNEEELLLENCLRAFFPRNPFRGQQVIDIITMPKFKQCVDEAADIDFGKLRVDDKLSVNQLIRTLKRYLDNPSKDDKKLLMAAIKKVKAEEDEFDD